MGKRWDDARERYASSRVRLAVTLRQSGYRLGEYCHTSPVAAVAPWLGTLIGSWIVGANTGSWFAIAVGAVIAGIGCAPVAAGAAWLRLDRARVARREARERKALQYASMELLPSLGECTLMNRRERIVRRDEVLRETVGYLEERIYRDDSDGRLKTELTTRVVVYVLAEGNTELRSFCQAGRSDPASVFLDGDGGRGQKAFDELLLDRGTYESDLVGRDYVAYVSAPIASGTEVFGMVTVDTTDYQMLDRDDRDALEVIAAALAVFFVEANRNARA